MEIQTSADPAVLWLRARQFCYLGGDAPESGETIGTLQKLKDGMPADLADTLKADEEERKTDHAPLVAAKENDEVATMTATIKTNLLHGGLETRVASLRCDQASPEWEEERQQSRAGTRHHPRHRESRDRGGRHEGRSPRDGEFLFR